MWYNCTFPQNETLNDACRSSGNTKTSADQGVSACFLGVGNATHFNQCVGTRGNVTDVKYLQDWSNKAPASASAGSESAARPHRSKEFSWTTLFCLRLMVLNCVVAQVEPEKDPTCTRFVADDKSTWHLNAETQHVVVSNGLGCSSGLSHPCLMGMENRSLYFEPIWASDSPEGPISVTGDFKSLDRPEGRAIADKVSIPFVPDEFPVPSGPIGIVVAKTKAATVPERSVTVKATQTLAYKRDVTVPEVSGRYYSTATKYQGKPAEGQRNNACVEARGR